MYNMEGHCKFYERERAFKFQIFKGKYESELEFPKGRGVQTNSWSIDFSETNFFQVQEEEMLVAELRKIEMRKKEREKKQQDLQKLITAAENQADSYRLK